MTNIVELSHSLDGMSEAFDLVCNAIEDAHGADAATEFEEVLFSALNEFIIAMGGVVITDMAGEAVH